MGKIDMREKFPCGYEQELHIDSIWLTAESQHNKETVCPLHGKNCPPNKDKI